MKKQTHMSVYVFRAVIPAVFLGIMGWNAMAGPNRPRHLNRTGLLIRTRVPGVIQKNLNNGPFPCTTCPKRTRYISG